MNSEQWRYKIKKMRDALSSEDRHRASIYITKKILAESFWQKSKNIAIYLSYQSEFQTNFLIEAALTSSKTIGIPICQPDHQMIIAQFTPNTPLKKNKYGIDEIPEEFIIPITPSNIDCCIVPGLAFDLCGHRIGYGGGYYDRFLPNLHLDCPKVACAFDIQVISDNILPQSPTDHLMTHLFTESHSFNFV